MTVSVLHSSGNGWKPLPAQHPCEKATAQLVLCFAGKYFPGYPTLYKSLQADFPAAQIVLCSTAGEIAGTSVYDNSAVVTAMHFDRTGIRAAAINSRDYKNSYEAAQALAGFFPAKELTYVLILSDGSLVNGSELVKGLQVALPGVLVTGGLAGDGADFVSTDVGLNGKPEPGTIVAIGFYGKKLVVTHGSKGGWDPFGLEKEITRSQENVLYEIDHENALDLYKKYLGPDADRLPGSALLFPISVTLPGATQPVVRTILKLDDTARSMTFAGDVPVGSTIRFMRANFDALTMAASAAAGFTLMDARRPDFSLLISCVGRKLALGPRVEEEVEAVQDTFGIDVPMAGFYSYGEISPFNDGGGCQLHNQTMTITSFYELP